MVGCSELTRLTHYNFMQKASRYVPLLGHIRVYNREKFSRDLIAAMVVTIMLIPQSLAYAMLAGLPAELGLYASIFPLLAYALLGSSNTLAVGPVAITSLMTASALGKVTALGLIGYIEGAILLALMSGAFLLLLGVFRLGFISNFLSHPVVAGFITASGLVIALSQFKHLLGITAQGHNFIELASSTLSNLSELNVYTLIIGIFSVAFLYWARKGATALLMRFGLSKSAAASASKAAPVVGVALTTLAVAMFSLDQQGVAVVGSIPTGMPSPALPSFSLAAAEALFIPAVLISIIGYVESVSVGRTLAAKKRERIDGNQELLALGAANIASGVSGAFPVTGGFSRSVVNYDAGAETQFAAIFTAIGLSFAALFLTPYLYYLPIAMLAATIIVAVLSLVDFSIFKRAWQFSKSDFAAVSITVALTLLMGVEVGVASGIIASILLLLYHTSKPHIAEVGLLPNTEHFRNILHFDVEHHPCVLSLRIDESLLFSNVSYLEEYIYDLLPKRPETKVVILDCAAVNTVDLSAIEMLESLNHRLSEQGIDLHLSHVKIPVQRMLKRTHLMEALSGEMHLTQFEAYRSLVRNYQC